MVCSSYIDFYYGASTKMRKNFSIYLLISRWSLNRTTKSSSNKTNNKEPCLKMADQLLSLNTYQYSFKDSFVLDN